MILGYLILAIVTTIFGLVFNRLFLNSEFNTSFEVLLLESILIIISFTLPNIVFIWMMMKIKVIEKVFLKKIQTILLETFLLYSIFYLINLFIEKLPESNLFDNGSTHLLRHVYFTFYFKIGYSFIILFIFLFLYKVLYKGRLRN
jgi:hypothetical protein